MISHKHKCIFIHIPKTAGSSIYKYFFPEVPLIPQQPNYEIHYGWCPKRRIYLQHANAFELLDTGLISKDVWNSYYKFTFVRNPWDRSYSDYLWAKRTSAIKDSFHNYITAQGDFKAIFSNPNQQGYKGNHLIPQSKFFDENGKYAVDYVGKFENLDDDMKLISKNVGLSSEFKERINFSTSRHSHYSLFYTKTRRELVARYYSEDIERFNYGFDDRKKGFYKIKNLI